MKKNLTGLIILFVFVSLILLLTGCMDDNSQYQDRYDRSKLEIIREKSVDVGGIKWELLKVEETGPRIKNEFGATLESIEGRFIYIEFSVENLNEEIKQLLDLKVVDDKGNVYSICSEAYGYLISPPEACILKEIYPDIKQTFNASFDVPISSVDLVLEVTDLNIPPQERVYIDLGF